MDETSAGGKPRRKTATAFRFVGLGGGSRDGYARVIVADGPEGREYVGVCRRVGVNAPGQAATYQAELWPAPRPEPGAEGGTSQVLGPGYARPEDVQKAVRAQYRDSGAWWR